MQLTPPDSESSVGDSLCRQKAHADKVWRFPYGPAKPEGSKHISPISTAGLISFKSNPASLFLSHWLVGEIMFLGCSSVPFCEHYFLGQPWDNIFKFGTILFTLTQGSTVFGYQRLKAKVSDNAHLFPSCESVTLITLGGIFISSIKDGQWDWRKNLIHCGGWRMEFKVPQGLQNYLLAIPNN